MLTKTGWLFCFPSSPLFLCSGILCSPCSCMTICLVLPIHPTPLSFISGSVSSLCDATLLRLRLHKGRVKPHRLLLSPHLALFTRRTKARSAAHRLLVDVHPPCPCLYPRPRLRILNLLLDSCSSAAHMSIKTNQVARRSGNDLHDLRGGEFAR